MHAGRKEQPKKGKDKEKTPEVDDEFDWRLAKANGEPPRYRGTWHCLSLQGCASVGKDYSQQLRAKVAEADKKKRAEKVNEETIVEETVHKHEKQESPRRRPRRQRASAKRQNQNQAEDDGEQSDEDVIVHVGRSAYVVDPTIQHQRNTATRLAMPRGRTRSATGGVVTKQADHNSKLSKGEIEAERRYQRKQRLSELENRCDKQRRQLEDLMSKHG